MDGFQYVGDILQFFLPMAIGTEGYVDVTTNIDNGKRSFNYVYNYTDHLGNIRLSYTQDPVLKATAIDGAEISPAPEVLIAASGDKSITVNVAASDKSHSESGMANIGVFEYANVSKSNKKIDGKTQVTTKQTTNPEKLKQMDNFFEKIVGTSLIHEIVESYKAGQMVQDRGVSSGNGNSTDSVYGDAHEAVSTIASEDGSLNPMI